MPHPRPRQWELTPKQAVALQRELAERIVLQPLPSRFGVLAAADISYLKSLNRLVAVVLTFRWPSLERLETVHAVAPIRFPYVPGLLSFREIPPVLEAIEKLINPPEVFLCDGQGIAHPRRVGLAAHLGLCLEVPTVGCAKSRLCGSHEPLDLQRGNYALLRLMDEVVGCVFCSRTGVKPLYISPGHLADVDTSMQLVERCLGRYRIPEPLRQAHQTAAMLRKSLFPAE